MVETEIKTDPNKEYTIAKAAVRMSMTEPYVRSLIRTGKLVSEMRPMGFESRVTRHIIRESDIEEFLRETTRKTKRGDGRNKYVFYANSGEAESVDQALRAAGLDIIADSIKTVNNLKPKDTLNE